MVIGSGMVALRFSEYESQDHFLIFASGVSNSKELNTQAYNREKKLLEQFVESNLDKTIVYFSTCSIYDPEETSSRYVLHKKEVEDYIMKRAKHFHIFRVSNLVGHSANSHTLINFLYRHISQKKHFTLWENAYRNLLDIDDMYLVIDSILKQGLFRNEIINIANPSNYPVKDVIKTIEKFTESKGQYQSIPKGSNFLIDVSAISAIIQQKKIIFDNSYLLRLLSKYYPGR